MVIPFDKAFTCNVSIQSIREVSCSLPHETSFNDVDELTRPTRPVRATFSEMIR